MKTHQDYRNTHAHDFGQGGENTAQKRVFRVMILTLITLFAEIVTGYVSGSMALLADGIHMGTHALALGLAVAAYYFVRRHAHNRRFSFGSGKINDLTAYSTALLLLLTTLWLVVESVERLFNPRALLAAEAMTVAVIGLAVNLLSAWWLAGAHPHHHSSHTQKEGSPPFRAVGFDFGRGFSYAETPCGRFHLSQSTATSNPVVHDGESLFEPYGRGLKPKRKYDEHHHHSDHNLQAALMHVLADAATSVAAILGIGAAWVWGWWWLDQAIALVASMVILHWAVGLMRRTGAVLLDAEADADLRRQIEGCLNSIEDTEIVDLHIWSVGPGVWTMVAALIHHGTATPLDYKHTLSAIDALHHPIIEVQTCHECEKES